MRDRIPRRRCRESKAASAILIANLIELIFADFAAEADRVLAPDYRRIVEELQRAVLVFEWAIGAIADPVIVGDADARDSP